MTLSALFLGGIFGVSFSFISQEVLNVLIQSPQPALVLPLQIMGALFMALVIINWMSRANLIGGIYNRPLALGNTLHFGIGAITLTKYVLNQTFSMPLIVITACYILFAVVFFKVIFTTPKKVSQS